MYIHKLKIGKVELENNILLAPMAGITDLSFRKMVKKYSNPGLVYTEMVSAKAIVYNDQKTQKLINTKGEKRPVCMQLFGHEPEIIAQAAKIISKNADIIDINMGCPAPKITKNGEGSKLLCNLDLAKEIIVKTVKATDIPVTVKIRTGWNKTNKIALDLALIAEKAGAKAIIIHGRTKEDFFSGDIDFDIIKQVKKIVNIPVIGNGNIFSGKDAIKMFEETNVDGIMIGRANLGNPYKIKEIIDYCNYGKQINESKKIDENLINIIKEHLELLIEEKGEYTAIREMRKHLGWYLKNIKNASKLRDKINKIINKDEIIKLLEENI